MGDKQSSECKNAFIHSQCKLRPNVNQVLQEKKSGQDPTHAWARSQKFESNGMRIRTAGRRMGKIEYKQVQSDPAHLLNIRDMGI
jgi:hypothetical protein